MATQAQKDAEITAATKRVEKTAAKLDSAQMDVIELENLLTEQRAHLEWVSTMPVTGRKSETGEAVATDADA